MEKETLMAYFPQAVWSETRPSGAELVIELPEQGYLAIESSLLTEREQLLVNLLQDKGLAVQQSPWQAYFDGVETLPQAVKALQILHVHIWSEGDRDGRSAWLDMMKELLPNLLTSYAVDGHHYLFVLDQSLLFDVREILRDTLATMEFDFGLRMTIFLGQLWPDRLENHWPQLVQSEEELFKKWRSIHNQSCLLTFSQLYLWNGSSFAHLQAGLRQLIAIQQLEDVIEALWAEGAVLTKAAQRLYIHRNTLQYRLDKWHEWTGLQLKDLDDLAICHQAILGIGW